MRYNNFMKVVMLLRPKSEHDTSANQYAKNFSRVTGKELSIIDYDSVEGIELAKIHDITSIPAILALRDDSSLMESWQEQDKWPTPSELSFYAE
jgi:hypothetical protein